MMCWCKMVGQAWGNCVSRGEEQAGSFCFSYNAPSYTSSNALKNCWCWYFAVIESVLVQPSTCSPECYHGLHTVHCSIMCCNEVQCSAVQCSAVELLIYIGGAPADSLVRGRGKGSLGQHTLRQFWQIYFLSGQILFAILISTFWWIFMFTNIHCIFGK